MRLSSLQNQRLQTLNLGRRLSDLLSQGRASRRGLVEELDPQRDRIQGISEAMNSGPATFEKEPTGHMPVV